jgi:DASS family divalent anion:Na+ symporter
VTRLTDEATARFRVPRAARAGLIAAAGVVVSQLPPPDGLDPTGWYVLVIFGTAIVALLLDAADVLPVALTAIAVSVLTGVLAPADAYASFASDTVLLIVMAFLISHAVVTSGLGRRIAYLVVRRMGGSSLGLGYAMAAVDVVIAPAFPSNTARSGVIYPVTESLARANGSRPDDGTANRLGAYLMVNGIAHLALSSALWLTAMAANPIIVDLAAEQGVEITFGGWVLAASVPTLLLLAITPWLLHRVLAPTLRDTPEAPRRAAQQLAAMGGMTRGERITLGVFIGLVLGWSVGGALDLDRAAVAMVGLAVLLLTRVLGPEELKSQGGTLSVWLWFGSLLSLATAMNDTGVTIWLGDLLAGEIAGLSALVTGVLVVLSYTVLHYLFVSQTAHVVALYGVFLAVGIASGVPAAPLALALGLASNYFAPITPQASSGNLLFVGSGYVPIPRLYRYGAMLVTLNTLVLLVVGFPWLILVT